MYIEQELSDLMESFGAVFQVSDFELDAENVWEWIEGKSQSLQAEINITREHTWDKGEYSKPLQIRIKFTVQNQIQDELINTLGKKICKQFNTDVIYGKILYIKGDVYDFTELKKFSI
jgi:hypothetical protein